MGGEKKKENTLEGKSEVAEFGGAVKGRKECAGTLGVADY